MDIASIGNNKIRKTLLILVVPVVWLIEMPIQICLTVYKELRDAYRFINIGSNIKHDFREFNGLVKKAWIGKNGSC